VPPGLRSLTASLDALARFLDLDQDLLDVAAETSPPPVKTGLTDSMFNAWIGELSSHEKDAILLSVLQGKPGLQAELQRRVRAATAPARQSASTSGRRTLGDLIRARDERAAERKRREAEAAEQARHRRSEETRRAREAHLQSLMGQEDALWRQVEICIGTKKPKEYDRAVEILKDLRDLATREEKSTAFDDRLNAVTDRHSSKPSLMRRLDRARLT
jgi:hypothetical protein